MITVFCRNTEEGKWRKEKTMKRKVIGIFLALLMVFGLAAPMAQAIGTEGPKGKFVKEEISTKKPDSTKLVIHKLAADSYNSEEFIKGNGGKIDQTDLGKLGVNVVALQGVDFHGYKITDDATWKELNANKASYKTKTQMDALVPGKATYVGVQKTDVNGEATFSGLKEGNYWFVEGEYTQTPAPGKGDPVKKISNSIAVPFGITLAATNPEAIVVGDKSYEAGTVYLKTIHAYPKNTIGDVPVPEKTVDNEYNKHSLAEIGKEKTWFLQTPVPANVKDYDTWDIKDTFSKGLTYMSDDAKVYFKGKGGDDTTKTELVKGTDYTITQPAKGTKMDGTDTTSKLEIKLTQAGIDKLGDNYTKAQGTDTTKLQPTLFIEVVTKINDEAPIEQIIPNKFILNYKIKGEEKPHETPSDTPDVKTGGKRFVKVDADKKETKLEGAIFQLFDGDKAMKWSEELLTKNLANNNGGLLMMKKDDGTFVQITDAKKADAVGKDIYLASNSNGQFEIVGLEYSKWTKTTKEGTEDITHSYKLTEVKAPDNYNLPNSADFAFTVDKDSYYKTENISSDLLMPADPLEIENKKLEIPPVGGIGTLIFTVAGLAIMGGSVVAYKKSRKEDVK